MSDRCAQKARPAVSPAILPQQGPHRAARPATALMLAVLTVAALALLPGCVARTAPGGGQPATGAPAATPAPAPQPCPPGPGLAPAPQCAHDLEAVSAVVQALVAARNACDPAALLELYAEGAGIMTWLPEEGRDAIVPRLRFATLLPAKAANWRTHGRTHTLTDPPAVTITGDTARAEFDLLVREGEAQATGHFSLLLLRQPDGPWRITRETYAQPH
ncbi:YybH family protein [Desulfocurvus vexinensis]|uniref:YybH family protein n=1 Tax=Desulfocurvus vexinensis TaxID=399548 RepID=UPI00048CC72E|nr:nuclear transport factor 2 family protein [Desulfocurvus vexinensis]